MPPPLRRIRVLRYVTPLREGGSLPAIVEADDDGLYVLKFRRASQGPRVLVAELIAGSIGRALGLPVPELVLAEVDRELARTEPDSTIHQLIFDSAGLNLALDYLPGSVMYNPVTHRLDREFATRVLWFDALITNVDRTVRNTNMLMWHRKPWLIDHGASMYFHHRPGWETALPSRAGFPLLANHVLQTLADPLVSVDDDLADRLTPDILTAIVEAVPDEWLQADEPKSDVTVLRAGYLRYLTERLAAPRPFLDGQYVG